MSVLLNHAPASVPESTHPPQPRPAPGHERLQLLRCMLADRDWCITADARRALERIAEQLRQPAAVIGESGWTLLADETASYLDFRRLGNLEAQLRGCTRAELRYTRADWEVSRIAEAALHAHHRQARDASYVPVPAPEFRIH